MGTRFLAGDEAIVEIVMVAPPSLASPFNNGFVLIKSRGSAVAQELSEKIL